MGIIYQVLIRCIKVKDLEDVDTKPFPEKDFDHNNPYIPSEWDNEYLNKAKENSVQKFNEIYINGYDKRDLAIINYPIHEEADIIAFTNSACDEYDGGGFTIIFSFQNGITKKTFISTNWTSFSRVMVKIPRHDGKKPSKLAYYTGPDIKNLYDLEDYEGEKKTSVEEGYYWTFRVSRDHESSKFKSIVKSITANEWDTSDFLFSLC